MIERSPTKDLLVIVSAVMEKASLVLGVGTGGRVDEWAGIRALAEKRLAALREVIPAQRREGPGAARASMLRSRGKNLVDTLRARVGIIPCGLARSIVDESCKYR